MEKEGTDEENAKDKSEFYFTHSLFIRHIQNFFQKKYD